MVEQLNLLDHVGWSGKTSLEPLVRENRKGRTSKESSPKSLGLSNLMPLMCLCLTKDGHRQDASTMTWEDGLWPGAPTMPNTSESLRDAEGLLWLPISQDSRHQKLYLTLNIGEKPRHKNQQKLSEILDENPNEKYSLSPKACLGILKRAQKRGKELPVPLREALESQARL